MAATAPQTSRADIRQCFELDASTLGESELSDHLQALADVLLNRVEIAAGSRRLRIVETEVYFNAANHRDLFTHSHPLQGSTAGSWYFHTVGQGLRSFKGGTYKGLDVTFGAPNKGFGGFLLRAFEEGGEVVEGPCKLVDSVLQGTGHKSIVSLVDDNAYSADCFDEKSTPSPLRLVLRPAGAAADQIVASPRVGLSLKVKAQTKFPYLFRNYRYTVRPEALKKQRMSLCLALRLQGRSEARVQALTGVGRASLAKWESLVATGVRKSGSPSALTSFFGRALNVGAYVELYGIAEAEQWRARGIGGGR